MVRFFLHVRNGNGFIPDEEGHELEDETAARAEAVKSVRSIISDEASSGIIDLTGQIEIADARGARVLTVPFAEAFQLKLRTTGEA
jgi:hypothetical protein